MENINKLNTEITKYLITKLKIELVDSTDMKISLNKTDLIKEFYDLSDLFMDRDTRIIKGNFNLTFSDCCFMVSQINLYELQNEGFSEFLDYMNEDWVFNTYCFVYSRILFEFCDMAKLYEIDDTLYHIKLDDISKFDYVVQKTINVYLLNFKYMKNSKIKKIFNKYIKKTNKKKTIKKLLHNTNLETDIIENIINTY